MKAISYSQRSGKVIISTDGGDVTVDPDEVPALLQVVLTALRMGDHGPDQLDACMKACKANLGKFLR